MNLKAYLLDTASVALFWSPIIVAYLLIVGVKPSQLPAIMAGSVTVDLAFSWAYGRFLNKWRKRLNYT